MEAKTTKISLDTFGCSINVVITDTPNKYLENIGLPHGDFSNTGGMTIYAKEDLENYYIIFPSEIAFEAIVHESVHCINKIFLHRGVRMDFDNDESYAYHVSWLADKIFCFLDDNMYAC